MSKLQYPFWKIDTPVSFRIFGEPQEEPKKIPTPIKLTSGQVRINMVPRDWKTKTIINPATGKKKTEKYDIGYKGRWFKLVQETVYQELKKMGLKPFPANYPIALGIVIWRTQSKSNDFELPSVTPDDDNYFYYIHNALKKTDDDFYPYKDGVLYYDDNCICYHPFKEGKFWATEQEPPGAMITVQDAYYLLDEIEEFQPGVKTAIFDRTAQNSLFSVENH